MQNVDNLLKKSSLCGEITIFLSFVLILILALLGTVLESARLSAAKCKADRILDNSMNYVFTEYCRPLWKDYHLLFLEGEKSEQAKRERIISSLEDCENASFVLSKNEYGSFHFNLLSLNKLKTEIEDMIYANDLGGEIFGHEVTQYMKYQLLEKEEKEKKKMIKEISKLNHTFELVDKQIKVEQQMGNWNKIMLQIMSNIDGISVGKNGLKKNWSGKIKTEPVFIKQLCSAQRTPHLLGINSKEIWNSLREKYINPVSILEDMEKELHKLDEERKERERAEREREEQEKRKEYEKQNPIFTKNMSVFSIRHAGQNTLIKKAEQIIVLIDETEILFSELKKEQEKIEPNMKQWKDVWKQEEELPPEVKRFMQKEKNDLEASVQQENVSEVSVSNRILKMKGYLEENKKILQKLLDIRMVTWGDGEAEINSNLILIASLKKEIKKYHAKELFFDYGSVKLEKEENPLESIPHNLSKGILPYVVENMSKISKKKKEIRGKPIIEQPTFSTQIDYKNLQKELDYIGEGNNSFQGSQWLKKSFEKQLDSITMSKYLQKHFKMYGVHGNEKKKFSGEQEKRLEENHNKIKADEDKENKNKKTILDYEQEYIIAGKSSDEKNLEAVVFRLILIRTMFNYVYLLTDKQATEKAYITAQGIVGLTCMEPLVLLTKQLILFIWAAEEAIIDIGGLLAGKSIPLWKQKSTFQMKYKDILNFNQSFVKKKVKELPRNNSNICFDYENYLSFFFHFSKRKTILDRTMQEVEDNIKCRYDENFVFSECIYGFRISEEYYIPKKFLQLPFVSVMLGDSISGWRIKRSKVQCY